ncbi:DUF3179 domain-containing (seleno)protein [Desulfoluna butyratoxydans]|uniref:DUF3179 domain-containing (seleno)protein n=1 Tax=Desulfoluna butyratoxydans TaxID=231438 RepID=UPI003CCDA629
MDLSAVYSRELDGEPLTLAPSGWTYGDTFVLYDKESRSLWYPDGKGLLAIDGPHAGKRLPEIGHEDTSWYLWEKAHPKTRIAD